MRKRAIIGQEETTPGFEVFGGKRPKRSGPDEEAQQVLGVITVDSSKRAMSCNTFWTIKMFIYYFIFFLY